MRTRRFAALALLATLMLAALAPQARAELIGYWTFDASTGADLSAFANNGTVGASVSYVPAGGWNGNTAILTPGANVGGGAGVVTVPNSPSMASISNSFAISYWMNAPIPTNPAAYGRIFQKGTEANGAQSWMVNQNNNTNDVNVRVDTGPAGFNQNIAAGGPAVYTSSWHHVVFSVNNGSWQKYVDGASAGAGAYNAGTGLGNTQPLYIGGGGNNSQYGGMIDDVALWSTAVSPIELPRLANDTLNPMAVSSVGNVAYKIVAYNGDGTVAGNTQFAAYLSDLRGGVGSTGIQFAAATGTTTASAAGSLPIRVANPLANPGDADYEPDRLHVQATLNFGTPDPTILDPRYYLAAQLTAPPGYVFEFLSGASTVKSQYFTSLGRDVANPPGTSWTASPNSWEDQGAGGVSTNPYAVPVSSANLAGGPWAPATQGMWARLNPTTVYDNVYFDAPLRMIPGAWSVLTDPVANPGTQPGLSAQIARVGNNIDTLAQATAALALTPGQANFNASQVVAIPQADLDAGGNFNAAAGVLPGDTHSAAANPEDYAVRMAGYMQITPGNLTRTFALRGDNEWTFSIGGNQYIGGGDSNPPTLLPLTFPSDGYYPFEVLYRNRDGAALLEVSSALGIVGIFDTATFALLGSDPVGLPVLQDPNYTPGTTQANSVGAPLVPGGINPVADGFRVQQAYPASHGSANPGDVANAVSFFADKIIVNGNQANYNVGVVAWDPANPDPNLRPRTRLDMQDTTGGQGITGNLSPTDAVPIDNFNTSYAAQAGVANDNYVTRMNGLLYIDAPGVRAFTVSTDDGYYLRVGSQVLGTRPGAGGTPGGTANTVYGNFPAAGLYPFEFYKYEGGGGSGLEIGQGGSTNLLLASGSRNPASNGFTTDFTNLAYRVEPVAALKLGPGGTDIDGKAFGNVPALAMNAPVEHWKLERRSAPQTQGLRATYYNTNGLPDDSNWQNSAPVFGSRIDWGILPNAPFATPFATTNLTDALDFYRPFSNGDNFGTVWKGFINIPNNGALGQVYNFQTQADDRGWLFIDIDGDSVLDSPGGLPIISANWLQWNGQTLAPGLHAVEFRSREFGGGETFTLQWDQPGPTGFEDIAANYLRVPFGDEYYTWEVLAQGDGTSVGDLLSGDFGDLYTFPYGSQEHLRLSVDIAGLQAIAEGDFLFVPEPTTLVLLGGGLLALARRRRKTAR